MQSWVRIMEYLEALEKALGKNGVFELQKDAKLNQSKFENMAERAYINWMQTIAKPSI